MDRSPLIPESIWLWAWRRIAAWSGLDLNPRGMSARERWSVAVVVVCAVAKSRYLRPLRLWFLARSPAWAIALRLERATHRWFRIPDRAAAEHVMLRFDFYPLDAGDLVRIECGALLRWDTPKGSGPRSSTSHRTARLSRIPTALR